MYARCFLSVSLISVLTVSSVLQAGPVPQAIHTVSLSDLTSEVAAKNAARQSNLREIRFLLSSGEAHSLSHLFPLEKVVATLPSLDDATLEYLARESRRVNDLIQAGAASQEKGDFDTALNNLETSCGERYRSGFSEQDHGRFYCLDAFARYCALKKGPNQQQLEALRHDYEVLRSQGMESRCPYFGPLEGTYNGGIRQVESGQDRGSSELSEAEAQARQDAELAEAARGLGEAIDKMSAQTFIVLIIVILAGVAVWYVA